MMPKNRASLQGQRNHVTGNSWLGELLAAAALCGLGRLVKGQNWRHIKYASADIRDEKDVIETALQQGAPVCLTQVDCRALAMLGTGSASFCFMFEAACGILAAPLEKRHSPMCSSTRWQLITAFLRHWDIAGVCGMKSDQHDGFSDEPQEDVQEDRGLVLQAVKQYPAALERGPHTRIK